MARYTTRRVNGVMKIKRKKQLPWQVYRDKGLQARQEFAHRAYKSIKKASDTPSFALRFRNYIKDTLEELLPNRTSEDVVNRCFKAIEAALNKKLPEKDLIYEIKKIVKHAEKWGAGYSSWTKMSKDYFCKAIVVLAKQCDVHWT